MFSMLHCEWPGDNASDKTDKGCGNLVIFVWVNIVICCTWKWYTVDSAPIRTAISLTVVLQQGVLELSQ